MAWPLRKQAANVSWRTWLASLSRTASRMLRKQSNLQRRPWGHHISWPGRHGQVQCLVYATGERPEHCLPRGGAAWWPKQATQRFANGSRSQGHFSKPISVCQLTAGRRISVDLEVRRPKTGRQYKWYRKSESKHMQIWRVVDEPRFCATSSDWFNNEAN